MQTLACGIETPSCQILSKDEPQIASFFPSFSKSAVIKLFPTLWLLTIMKGLGVYVQKGKDPSLIPVAPIFKKPGLLGMEKWLMG